MLTVTVVTLTAGTVSEDIHDLSITSLLAVTSSSSRSMTGDTALEVHPARTAAKCFLELAAVSRENSVLLPQQLLSQQLTLR